MGGGSAARSASSRRSTSAQRRVCWPDRWLCAQVSSPLLSSSGARGHRNKGERVLGALTPARPARTRPGTAGGYPARLACRAGHPILVQPFRDGAASDIAGPEHAVDGLGQPAGRPAELRQQHPQHRIALLLNPHSCPSDDRIRATAHRNRQQRRPGNVLPSAPGLQQGKPTLRRCSHAPGITHRTMPSLARATRRGARMLPGVRR